ncbi:zinc finger BED domain-containing protein RICESLEEPER 2-like [Senna tora]|uniref:Zinc finger BED domain-containing protein RICESLEEPER 2-like n=1 Tax=Senna tora TaxID=362788 RepID=A0A834SFG5_9FABA|nr:zinc finger BED domain-containing protein RICESLEEPER 2-like [Senna tora]
MPSGNIAVSDVKKIYEKEKEKLKQEMARIPNRVCLTYDMWDACTSEGYICLTTHFVDDNWKLRKGLKVTSDPLHKIGESVKYVKASDGRMQKFDDCVRESGGVETWLGIRLDVTTRWNSTYLMLESALRYQKAFTRFNLIDRKYKYCPSVEDWRRATKMREFLEPFVETTNLISGSKYPTSNLYFMQVWKIECMLNASLTNEDEVIRDMTHRMKVKLDKYWSEYSEVVAFGAILDPRTDPEDLHAQSEESHDRGQLLVAFNKGIFGQFKSFELIILSRGAVLPNFSASAAIRASSFFTLSSHILTTSRASLLGKCSRGVNISLFLSLDSGTRVVLLKNLRRGGTLNRELRAIFDARTLERNEHLTPLRGRRSEAGVLLEKTLMAIRV